MHILDTLEQCHLSKIRHYCDHSVNFIMAVPLENPMVASILPLILSCAPGDDRAIDALRRISPSITPSLSEPGMLWECQRDHASRQHVQIEIEASPGRSLYHSPWCSE